MAQAKKSAASGEAPKKIRVVKYVGTADVRIISRADWDNVDVDHDEVRWDKSNKWQIDASKFSDDALVYLDEDDDGFVIVDIAVDLSPVKSAPSGDVTYE